MTKKLLLIVILIASCSEIRAQTDSIIFKNGNYIVGEIKSMDKNILEIETDYSDSDFKIEWNGIDQIFTDTYLLISLSNGSRYNGHLKSTGPQQINIITDYEETIPVGLLDIVILEGIDKGFWSQLYATIDIGFDLAKANDFRQLSMRSNLGYIAKRWQLDGHYNTLATVQSDADDINNTEGGLTYKYFLPHDWYPLASIGFSSNTEQQLDLRISGKLGMGKYVIHTNKAYLGFSIGANYNSENYTPDSIADRESWEGFIGSELNMFNMGDLNLFTSTIAYPSLTESKRWRSDFKMNLKYDLPLDFYIKFGVTVNYDNQPAPGSPDTDYILHSGFGWEW